MLRLVESGLKFCKQKLKYGRHNSFFISKFEMVENRVQVYKLQQTSPDGEKQINNTIGFILGNVNTPYFQYNHLICVNFENLWHRRVSVEQN